MKHIKLHCSLRHQDSQHRGHVRRWIPSSIGLIRVAPDLELAKVWCLATIAVCTFDALGLMTTLKPPTILAEQRWVSLNYVVSKSVVLYLAELLYQHPLHWKMVQFFITYQIATHNSTLTSRWFVLIFSSQRHTFHVAVFYCFNFILYPERVSKHLPGFTGEREKEREFGPVTVLLTKFEAGNSEGGRPKMTWWA